MASLEVDYVCIHVLAGVKIVYKQCKMEKIGVVQVSSIDFHKLGSEV